MSFNTFGHLFRFTTWGESHGPALGCIVDGVPPRIELEEADIQVHLDRRRPGSSKFVTQRREPDQVKILSGVFEGRTTGTPISLMIENVDQRPRDYSDIKDKFRPAHADYTYEKNTESATTAAVGAHRRGKPRPGSRPAPSPARCWAKGWRSAARWCRWAAT